MKTTNLRAFSSIIRWMDKYVGFVLCAVLMLISRFHRRVSCSSEVRNILIMKFWEGGCIILGYPWFKTLRKKYPKARVTFLTLSANKDICEMLNIADEIISLDINKGIIKFVWQLVKMLPYLRGRNYDLLFDLEFLSRFSAITTYCIGAKNSFGFYSPYRWRGNFHTHKVIFNPEIHITDNLNNIFREAGIEDIEPGNFTLDISVADTQDIKEKEYIVVNLDRNGYILERCWPQEYYLSLIDYLSKTTKYKIAVISSESNSQVDKLSSENIINLCGKFKFSQLAGILNKARLFITHDSGPLHLAVMLGTPTISFFGPETPKAYGPIKGKHLVFYKGLDCSPCVNVYDNKRIKCKRKTNECLRAIKVDEVIDAMKRNGFLDR